MDGGSRARGLNRRGPEMGFVRPFLLSAFVLARRQGSGPFVGRAREAEEEQSEKSKWSLSRWHPSVQLLYLCLTLSIYSG